MASAPIDDDAAVSLSMIRSPSLPYVSRIPDGLFPGRAITVCGSVLSGVPEKRFQIDLCCGLLVSGDHMDNKALHFNPRFDVNRGWFSGPSDTQIVLNTLINNKWGVEERYPNVLKEGCPFNIRILVLSEYFKIAVDGRHLCDYLYRIPIEDVRTIFISGNIRVDSVEFQGEHSQVPIPARNKFDSGSIHKPKLPLDIPVKGGLLVGSSLRLTATPFMQAEHFWVNFLCDDEHLLHFRVDFPNNKQKAAVVRNSTFGGVWQKEERDMSEFPFTYGITFDAVFTAGRNCFNIEINGSHFAKFYYRGDVLLKDVNRIVIKGELSVQNVHLK